MVPFQGVRDPMTVIMLNEQMSSMLKDSHAKFLKIWNLGLCMHSLHFPQIAMGTCDQHP